MKKSYRNSKLNLLINKIHNKMNKIIKNKY